MRKGLHVARAMLPELALSACLWCGSTLDIPDGTVGWLGTYEPRFRETAHGLRRLCFRCACRCAELDGQPDVPMIFGPAGLRVVS